MLPLKYSEAIYSVTSRFSNCKVKGHGVRVCILKGAVANLTAELTKTMHSRYCFQLAYLRAQ